MKDNAKRMKRQVTDREKIFAKDTSDKGLLSNYPNNTYNSTVTKQPDLKISPKTLTGSSPKKMANKHMKRYSTSCVTREMQIKTTIRYHFITTRMVKLQNINNTKYW